MIDHLWRERLALADSDCAERRRDGAVPLARHLETLRRVLIASAKRVRDSGTSS